MTNINQINESDRFFASSNTRVTKSKQTDAFENVLGKALDNREAPEMETPPPQALREIASNRLDIIQSSDIVSGRTDTLLKMLDLYSSKLDDPNISLKSIAPVLEGIRENAGHLLHETERLTDADADLKEIATRTIVTAQTEYLKFQRGDYLP